MHIEEVFLFKNRKLKTMLKNKNISSFSSKEDKKNVTSRHLKTFKYIFFYNIIY